MIRLTNLTKRYGSFTAVDGIDLEVPSGELFGFLGPNGAGKTTLFRILTTLLLADEGEASHRRRLYHGAGGSRRANRPHDPPRAARRLTDPILAYSFAEEGVVRLPDPGGFLIVEEGEEGIAAAAGDRRRRRGPDAGTGLSGPGCRGRAAR